MAAVARRRSAGPLLFGAAIGNLMSVTPVVVATFGVFLVPIADEFGWSRARVAGAFTALSLATAVVFPLAGRLADRIGTRPVLVTGYLLLGLAILGLATLTPNAWHFYLMFALAGAAGALPSNMLLCKLLCEWFDQRRGFWMGLTSGIGNGLGSTVMPIVAVTLLASYGWRGAFTGIGLIVLLIGLPVAWLTLRPPQRPIDAAAAPAALTGASLGQALRSPLFWLLFSAVPIGGGCLTAVFANLVPVLTAVGLTAGEATTVLAAFALTCTVWEPIIGHLLDKSTRPRMVAPFYVGGVAGLLLLAHATSVPVLVAGGILTGVGLGTEFNVLPYLLSRYFGLRSLGAISGVAFAGVLTSTAIAPVGLNLVYDRTGSYAPAIYVVAGLLAYTAVMMVLLKPYPVAPVRDD